MHDGVASHFGDVDEGWMMARQNEDSRKGAAKSDVQAQAQSNVERRISMTEPGVRTVVHKATEVGITYHIGVHRLMR